MHLLRTMLGTVPMLALALLVTACGSATTGPGQQAPAATATPGPTAPPASDVPIPDAFHGTWTAETSGTAASGGTWTLRISADDMQLRNPRHFSDAEFFPLHAHDATTEGVSFREDPDCQAASYRWTLEGETLTLTAVDDPCIDRHDVLTSSPWHRSP